MRCEDYPCCGHDQNDCPEQSMEQEYGWSLDDFWEEEPLTPEQEAAERRQLEADARAEMMWEMMNAQYCFD